MNYKKYQHIKKKYFSEVDEKYATVSRAKKEIKSVLKLLDEYPDDIDLFAMPYDSITGILKECETLALSLRKSLAIKEEKKELVVDKKKELGTVMNEDDFLKENGLKFDHQIEQKAEEISLKDYPIEVEFDDGMLTVYSPLTFKRGYNRSNSISNYLLANYVKTGIAKWENDNKISLSDLIETPFICVMKRVDSEFSIFRNCDGDNLENQKIINVMTEALSLPDNAQSMSLYSIWRRAEEGERTGMYFYMFSEKDLQKHIDLLNRKTA